MPKPQDLLLILSSEERDAAEEFIQRRLKILDSDSMTDLEAVSTVARGVLDMVGKNSARLDPRSRTGQMMAKIYRNAQEGLAHLIRECNLAISKKQKDTDAAEGNNEGDEAPDLDGLMVEADSEDEEYALSMIESAISDMETAQIRELRDSTEELLTWWQTDGGMHDSLHINQWGDVNTANGRMAIRKIREEYQQEEIGPFRQFFQTVNLVYQKKNQEIQRQMRQKRLRQEAGLNE